ncbi:MAG TPA: isoprenylcysteine carboxylmethyltransferase family protein, partial [Sphingomicrobium sp.]|nr:isoprenylcysteine carboxylmethyltransferase family protein [Sphingomicrobium sp.]
KAATLLFAIIAYAIFFATFLYLIVFVGDFALEGLSPKTVDNPPSDLPLGTAAAINIGLIALFGLQHSVMARQGFKRAWTKIVPPQAERSMFVLIASLVLIIMFRFWQPIDTVVWRVESLLLYDLLFVLFWIGWLTVLVSTFLINHFELFGLQQAWLYCRGREAAPPTFRTPMFYRWVRHPLYLGFFIAFWATPEMTTGHLLLAIGVSIYMLIAIRYEERDLVAFHGRDYEDYRGRVGMLLPRFRSRA